MSTAEELRRPLDLRLEIRTLNELNRASSEHWRFRQKRAKTQRATVALVVHPHVYRLRGMMPLLVTCTRIAPGSGLDPHDGLPSSFKHCIDGLCDAFQMNDRNPSFTFRFDQRRGKRGEYAIEFRIETKGATT